MHGLTFLDILLWVILAAFAVKGFMKGLVREVCALVGFVAGAWAAFTYYASVAAAIDKLIKLPHLLGVTFSFVLIYLALGLLFFLVGHLLTVIFKLMLLGWVNRFGGIVFGILQGAFLLCITLALLIKPPVPAKIRGYVNSSATAQVLSQSGHDMIAGWKSMRAKQGS